MKDIFKDIDFKVLKKGTRRCQYKDLEYNSKKINPGDIFVALEGATADGHRYIDQAVESGAVAVFVSKEVELKHDIDYILIENLREKLGKIASNFYGAPEKKLKVIGVTGTNGKTTTTYLIEQLLGEEKVARLGTVEYKIGDEIISAPNTTPESLDIIKMSKKAVDKGLKYLVMEVSSHGLATKRVDMLEFDIAIFTNLTPEHLDYHKNMEEYYLVKKQLFKKLKKSKNAIINIDDSYGERLYKEVGGMSYSLDKKADLDKSLILKFKPQLLGKFNLYNLLGAIGVAKVLKISDEILEKKIASIKSAPGRFEPVYAGQDFKVIVDYAHTEDALKNILIGINDIKEKGKIITVFGCGGDRDTLKRPAMAAVAEKYSDCVIVTSDNPRTEDEQKILRDIEKGFKEKKYEIISDREDAIKRAIQLARAEDIVLIAGKGHEDYQIIGTEKIYFDDKEIAKKLIKKIMR